MENIRPLTKSIRAVPLLFALLALTVAYPQNKVTKITLVGNKRTKSSLIKKISRLKPGMELDSTLIKEDIQRLKRLPSISHAYFQVFPAIDEKGYNVYYGVEENFTLIPNVNVYTTNNDEFAFRLGLREFNLFGKNIIFGVFYQRDVFDSFGLHLRAPFLFNKKLGIAMSYQNLTTQEPVFLLEGEADYRYNNKSFEVLGLYQISLKHRLELGINFFSEDYDYLFGSTDSNVPQTLIVDKYLYKLIYGYDSLQYHYQYLSGFKSILNLQYVHSTNDLQLPKFIIGFNDFVYFERVGQHGNWANRLRLGISSNPDTPFAPFAVDNNLNIRGVGNVIDRGTASIVYNTEYRHTLVDKDWFALQGNMFMDMGTWRNPGGDFSDFSDSKNLRIYPGIGIRFIHKRIFNAIFRIDYGHGITKNASKGVVFGIGQYF